MKYAGTNIEIHDPAACIASLDYRRDIGLPTVVILPAVVVGLLVEARTQLLDFMEDLEWEAGKNSDPYEDAKRLVEKIGKELGE